MKPIEAVDEIAKTLLQLGAKVREDTLYIDIYFPNDNIDDYGLRFVKGFFDVEIRVDENNQLKYILSQNRRSISYVRVLPYFSAEANISRNDYPIKFWDGIWNMAHNIRDFVFLPREKNSPNILEAWITTNIKYRQKPIKELLLLSREIINLYSREQEKYKFIRMFQNSEKRKAYEELLSIVATIPHSLNILKAIVKSMKVHKISASYCQIDAVIDGREYSGWGFNAIYAARDILRQFPEEEINRKISNLGLIYKNS